ncbi:MAG TPA: c-type cytochrome, partial [Pirellulales bacterium]|nr:c-type cytochrome [Pirellulales bacterium]
TCEPTGNLVHRETIVPKGASFVGTPAYPDRDFLASRDTWFRPVNICDGFDGALYVVDMYRAVIEHPQFMPDELKERPDLWLGNDRGRIYRIVPADWQRPTAKPQLAQLASLELVKLLERPSCWWRETASRLLNERQDTSVVPALVELARSGATPQARVGALWVLRGMDALDAALVNAKLLDPHPRVREQAVVLSEPLLDADDAVRKRVSGLGMTEAAGEQPDERLRFQVALSLGGNNDPLTDEVLARIAVNGVDDVWTRRAVLTATPDHAARVLEKALRMGRRNRSENQLALVEELSHIVGARRNADEIAALLKLPLEGSIGVALVNGLAGGMRNTVRLSMFAETASKQHPELADYVKSWFEQAAAIAANAEQDFAARCEACDLLGQASYDMAAPVLLAIIDGDQSNDLRRRALAAFATERDERVGRALVERLAAQTPAMRSAIFDALLMNPERLTLLLDEIEAGRVRAGELGTLRANRIVEYRNSAIQQRAKKLLASAIPADRAKALADYQEVLTLKGDPRRGKEVFRKNCSTCHKLGDVGVDVGPSIAFVPKKTPEQMLVDILQPSKAIDNNYTSYSVVTTDGNAYTGIIAAETASSVTLKLPEGKVLSLLRTEIEELRSNGISLMPEGLERNVSKQDMADVISFVKNWRYLDSGVPASTVTGK